MEKNVWIIDDDQSILEVLKIILEEENYNVIIMDNQAAITKNIKSGNSPDVIIVDIHIAGLDGRYVVKKLKKNSKFFTVPILIMTADIHIEEKSKQAHADGYLRKPFDREELLKVIADFTSKPKKSI